MKITEKTMNKPHKSGKKRWEFLQCDCDTNSECQRCKYEESEESIPKEDFTVKDPVYDTDGNITGTVDRLVTEIKVIRGSKDDVLGWVF